MGAAVSAAVVPPAAAPARSRNAPAQPPAQPSAAPGAEFSQQLETLAAMGFTNRAAWWVVFVHAAAARPIFDSSQITSAASKRFVLLAATSPWRWPF
jgi:hypothetical protein